MRQRKLRILQTGPEPEKLSPGAIWAAIFHEIGDSKPLRTAVRNLVLASYAGGDGFVSEKSPNLGLA